MSHKAMELGADVLSIVSPYFVAISQEDIYRYYSTIAESVDLQIVLYNIPARTGNNISYTAVRRLSRYPNIVGIKDSSGNFDNTFRYIENTDRWLSVLTGNDSLILWTLLAGGSGAIAGTANVYPEIVLSIYKLWKAGKIDEANQEQAKLRPLRDVMKPANANCQAVAYRGLVVVFFATVCHYRGKNSLAGCGTGSAFIVCHNEYRCMGIRKKKHER